jgi:transcriptional regulator with XRE-family HTH domain
MLYQAEQFARTLRQARLRKGWSQRDLSQKAGVPQAHISRIENGVVDVKLSTLVELARFLDLDLVLAPRAALPAIQALIHEAEANQDLASLARRLRQAHPDSRAIERLEALAPDIAAIAPLFQAPGALAELQDAIDDLQAAADAPGEDRGRLDRAVARLSDLRNSRVHARSATPAPAYSLEEED